ncbi:unnamed protein product [Rotaria magnacalcarata]|nr:unnamed protein product [Rotaria magnacalcarata]CAF2065303.1 unnamed protein product [Rotaria magnacalcarata]CAF2080872.1 unnamed protein product [Rotaria magnacalcarata]CAF3881387.1 unnamed protein product [Rotaria magnacalcarata]CAF3965313.1 unnamed protein product [Rotaria magnacalcarata]
MSSTNNYLAALALVDIVYLILTLILNTSQHPCFTSTSISAILVTIFRPIADFSSNTSVWLTVTFTVERWVAISYPLQSRTWCTVSRARRIIISVMCAALICTLPSAFEMKLVRIIEIKNSTEPNEEPLVISSIRAKPTALGNSLLYHQIYFNFVTFAIIWIPLLLLVIFNTILIIYVHRSAQSEQKNSQGIQLRRHTQGNQGEQRKTTIMLIAVVIVFTVCQIPQAISLTVQSFFHVLSQTPKVLIYNNFANCLVALNASINFVLYCCFSERFRSTFSSNFAFLTKYCTPYTVPHWKLKLDHSHHSISTDNMPYNYLYNPLNYSLPGHNLHAQLSNTNNDANRKYAYRNSTNCSHKRWQSLKQNATPLSLPKFNVDKKGNADLKNTLVRQSNETYPSPPVTSVTKTTSITRQSSRSITRDCPYRYSIEKTISSRPSTIYFTNRKIPSKHYSLSTYSLPRTILMDCSIQKVNKKFSIVSSALTERRTFHSHESLDYHKTEDIWIKRHLSNSTLEKNIDQRNPFLWKEILDVTV